MRDVKMFTSRTDILAKSAIFDKTPAEKWIGQRFFFTLKLSEANSIIWDSLNGGENPSYDCFVSVTDGQNVNP